MIKPADYGNYRDTKPDTWIFIDRHGNKAANRYDNTAETPKNKAAGAFYWTWHGTAENSKHAKGPYDVQKILDKYPNAMDEPDNPVWPEFFAESFYFWGEPMFGYYLMDDEYVIRKHAQMLCDAGVDFIAFDSSNFPPVYNGERDHPGFYTGAGILFEIYLKIRAEGKPTPQCTFIMPFGGRDQTCVKVAYEDFYKSGKYDDLWYRIDDKPLMLFDPDTVADPKLKNYFTFRRDMPDYHLGPTGKNQWPWLEIYPQHPFYCSDDDTQPEMMAVGGAQNSCLHPDGVWRVGSLSERDENGNYIARGRSFRNGVQPQPGTPGCLPEKGYNFREQWDRVFECDPKGVFITGWNEWRMGRFPEFIHYKNAAGVFVDQFCHEFSRDVEPMRGGHEDDYYFMLVDSLRKFKGARRREKADGIHKIDIKDFSCWDNVQNEYLDDIGDCPARNHPSYGELGDYVIPAGRNDFVCSKVAHDCEYIFFYMRTNEPIKDYTGPHFSWMQLLISLNGEDGEKLDMPAWEGYQFTVNRTLVTKERSVLEFSRGGWNWNPVCEIDIFYQGREMAIKIPRDKMLTANRKINFDFKWIDTNNPQNDPLEFYTHGDAAPNGRFAYRYFE